MAHRVKNGRSKALRASGENTKQNLLAKPSIDGLGRQVKEIERTL
jgi:hypothetical protein